IGIEAQVKPMEFSSVQIRVDPVKRRFAGTTDNVARLALDLGHSEAWAAHEAIAAAVYLFTRHPDDPRTAILEGANTPGDSDSIATLAGSLVGARAGLGALPAEWVRDVERSDELLELARSLS